MLDRIDTPRMNQELNDIASSKSKIRLLRPLDILSSFELSQSAQSEIFPTLQAIVQALASPLEQGIAIVKTELEHIEPVLTTSIRSNLSTGTPLKPEEVEELDQYMDVDHVESNSPAQVIVASVLTACLGFLEASNDFYFDIAEIDLVRAGFKSYVELLTRAFGGEKANLFFSPMVSRSVIRVSPNTQIAESNSDDLLHLWKHGHWIFFVITQALILCCRRLADAIRIADLGASKIELETATQLMWAAGASMKITGSFTNEDYHKEVRPTMTYGDGKSQVKSMSLSGVMTWDHDYLVNVVWKHELLPISSTLKNTLQTEYKEFVRAYKEGLSLGHKSICSKFGGREIGSLREPDHIAIDTLNKIEQYRLRQMCH